MSLKNKYNLLNIWLRIAALALSSYLGFIFGEIFQEYIIIVDFLVIILGFGSIFYIGYLAYKLECPNCKFRFGEGTSVAPARLFAPRQCPDCGFNLTEKNKNKDL